MRRVFEVSGVGGAVDEEGVLVAAEVAVVHHAALGVHAQGLGLGAAVGGGVVKGEVVEADVVGGDVEERAGVGGGVEIAVVRVGDDGAFAVLAAEGEVVLRGDADDLLIGAIADVDVALRGVVGGDQVDRALDGAEVAASVGGDGEIGRGGGGRGGSGGEAPDDWFGDARVAGEDGGVDGDVVGRVVGQHAGAGEDGGGVAGDDDGQGVVERAADGAGVRDGEVEGFDEGAAGVEDL